jgi:hypothetical protein
MTGAGCRRVGTAALIGAVSSDCGAQVISGCCWSGRSPLRYAAWWMVSSPAQFYWLTRLVGAVTRLVGAVTRLVGAVLLRQIA